MQNPEVTTQLTPPTLLEGFAGMGFAYVTTISDGTIKVAGRGPSQKMRTKQRSSNGNWRIR